METIKSLAPLAVWIVVLLLLAHTRAAEPAAPEYHELRIYTATTNKLDAVVERFRDTVDPVRRKHGIRTIAYWSAPGTPNGGTFAYLLAAASKQELQQREKEFAADPRFKEGYAVSTAKHGQTVDNMKSLPLVSDATAKLDFSASKASRAFELRVYSVMPGKLDAFRSRWRDHAVPIYERQGLHSVGCWVAEPKDADGHDQFVCLLAGASTDAIQQSTTAFHRDAEWRSIERETKTDGKLRSSVTAYKLTSTEFPPLK